MAVHKLAAGQADLERAACSGGGTVRRFLTPWILLVIASAVLSCAEVWPNPL